VALIQTGPLPAVLKARPVRVPRQLDPSLQAGEKKACHARTRQGVGDGTQEKEKKPTKEGRREKERRRG